MLKRQPFTSLKEHHTFIASAEGAQISRRLTLVVLALSFFVYGDYDLKFSRYVTLITRPDMLLYFRQISTPFGSKKATPSYRHPVVLYRPIRTPPCSSSVPLRHHYPHRLPRPKLHNRRRKVPTTSPGLRMRSSCFDQTFGRSKSKNRGL